MMKKDLPKPSLRDKLDALPFELEEAHWDQLASRLHANGGVAVEEKPRAAFNRYRLGLLLLLGLVIGGAAIYFAKNTKEPTWEMPVEEKVQVPYSNEAQAVKETKGETQDNGSKERKEKENKEQENNRAVQQQQQQQQQQQGTNNTIASTNNLKNTQKSLTKKRSTIAEQSTPTTASPSAEQNIESKSTLLNDAIALPIENSKQVDGIGQSEFVKAKMVQKASATELAARNIVLAPAPLATEIQPLTLNQGSLYSKISKIKLHTKKERNNRWGIISGFNFSNGKPGLFLGFSYQRKLKSPWYLETGIIFRRSNIKRWDIDRSNVRIQPDFYAYPEGPEHLSSLNYVDIPLLVKWKPIRQVSLHVGPRLGLLSFASGRATQITILDSSVDPVIVEERVNNNAAFSVSRIKSLRTIELGAVLGATWHLDRHLGIGLRSNFGLSSFSDPNVIGPSPQKRNLDIQFLVQLYL